jgi:hypothetical protein
VTNRKSQNSILFITTLGVYLGLMLVGASPQIIAQRAATTRNFDIHDEIEFKDDLDKKPDDSERSLLTDSVSVYLQDVEQLLAALGNLNRKGQFDTSTSPFEVSQTVFLPCEAFNKAGSYTARKFDNTNAALKPYLERFSKALTYGYSLGDCIKTAAYSDKEAVASDFVFKLDDKAFSVAITIRKASPASAASLLSALPPTFKKFQTKNSSIVRQKLIDATSFRSSNDQVFIVTRLPRASIDSLFAKDAK